MTKRGRSRRRELGRVDHLRDAVRVVRELVCDAHTEGQLIIGLDDERHVAGAVFNCPCDSCRDEILEDPDELIDLAYAMDAEELVLVTFVEPDRLVPTAADVARYEGLRVECLDEDVLLLDHLLFSGHRWRSVGEVSLSGPVTGDPGASTSW